MNLRLRAPPRHGRCASTTCPACARHTSDRPVFHALPRAINGGYRSRSPSRSRALDSLRAHRHSHIQKETLDFVVDSRLRRHLDTGAARRPRVRRAQDAHPTVLSFTLCLFGQETGCSKATLSPVHPVQVSDSNCAGNCIGCPPLHTTTVSAVEFI